MSAFTSLSAELDLGQINSLRVQVVDVSDAIADTQLDQIRSGVASILSVLEKFSIRPVYQLVVRHDPQFEHYNVVVPLVLLDKEVLRKMPEFIDALGVRDVDLVSLLPYGENAFAKMHSSILEQAQGQMGPLYFVIEVNYAKEAVGQQAG